MGRVGFSGWVGLGRNGLTAACGVCRGKGTTHELPVIVLTEAQEEEAAAIEAVLVAKARATAKYIARLMAS